MVAGADRAAFREEHYGYEATRGWSSEERGATPEPQQYDAADPQELRETNGSRGMTSTRYLQEPDAGRRGSQHSTLDLTGTATTVVNPLMKSKYAGSGEANINKAPGHKVRVVRHELTADGAPILRNVEIIKKLHAQPTCTVLHHSIYAGVSSLGQERD